MIDVKEGDILEWNAVNGPVRGYAMKDDGVGMLVRFDDGHSFLLSDIAGTASLKVIGKVKIR